MTEGLQVPGPFNHFVNGKVPDAEATGLPRQSDGRTDGIPCLPVLDPGKGLWQNLLGTLHLHGWVSTQCTFKLCLRKCKLLPPSIRTSAGTTVYVRH